MARRATGGGTTVDRRDTYERVTAVILAHLERGTVPWRKPWTASRTVGAGGAVVTGPRNAVSGRPYRGANALLLHLAPYADPRWLTFTQAAAAGGTVRKGERGTLVVLWKPTRTIAEDATTGERTERGGLYLRGFHVFNVAQCDGLTLPAVRPAPVPPPAATVAAAEAVVAGYPSPPRIEHGGDRACYAPGPDTVRVPERGAFPSPAHYYGTLYHELGHATGHPSRLNRPDLTDSAAFGAAVYSREELTAELCAAFLCAAAGIEQPLLPNQAAYVASWLRALRGDPKAVVLAAGRAQRAADHILGAGGPPASGPPGASASD